MVEDIYNIGIQMKQKKLTKTWCFQIEKTPLLSMV